MIFIIAALYPEIKPLIDYYKLKRDMYDFNFQIFRNDKIIVTVTGIGKINSAIGTSHVLTRCNVGKNDFVINFGICGAKESSVTGDAYLINKITDTSTKKNYYPDIIVNHPFMESDIETFDFPVVKTDTMTARLCDMESSGFYQAVVRYVYTHQIALIKIVSDIVGIDTVNEDSVYRIIFENLGKVDKFITSLINFDSSSDIFDVDEREIMELVMSQLKLTNSQRKLFYTECLHFKVRTGKKISYIKKFIMNNKGTKDERERKFEKILTYLH